MSDQNGKAKYRRSSSYQQFFNEKLVDTDILSLFSNSSALYFHLNPYHYDEKVLDLEDLLKKKLWELLEKNLTERQSQIINLLKTGLTQQEVSKQLLINQSSVVKSIQGNSSYLSKNDSDPKSKSGKKDKKDKIVYGGIIRKALKALEQDEEIQDIIKQLSELRENKW